MKIRQFRRDKRVFPFSAADSRARKDRERLSYERMVISSAVLSYVNREQPEGATFAELASALDYEISEIERAARALGAEKGVRILGCTVAPYLPPPGAPIGESSPSTDGDGSGSGRSEGR